MLIKDIIACLEAIAPPILQESYDNSGLLVGNQQEEVSGIIVSLDCVESVVEEAIEKGCNLIVAHHPIIFSGLKRLTGRNYIERTVIKALKNDIAIYAIHTNLDNVFHNGVNGRIAEKLQLTQTRILAPKKVLKKLYTFVPTTHGELLRQALFNAGAGSTAENNQLSYATVGAGTANGEGAAQVKLEVVFSLDKEGAVLNALRSAHPSEHPVFDIVNIEGKHNEIGSGLIGELEEALKPKKFLAYLKEKMELKVVKHTAFTSKKIKRIALCGGAGGFLLNQAKRAGADAFVTADYKYHEFFDADGDLMIADIGHYESERFTIDLLHEILSNNFSNFAVYRTERNTNPVHYYL